MQNLFPCIFLTVQTRLKNQKTYAILKLVRKMVRRYLKMYEFDELKTADAEIAEAITKEMERQNSHIELIASENWVSHAVMAAMATFCCI